MNKIHASLQKTSKTQNYGTSSCSIFESVFNQTPVYFTTVSAKRSRGWLKAVNLLSADRYVQGETMLPNILYVFLGHLHLFLRLSLGQRAIILKQQELCRIKLCGLQDLRPAASQGVSHNLRSEVHCMQCVICSLHSVVWSLESGVSSQQSAVCSLQLSDSTAFLVYPNFH